MTDQVSMTVLVIDDDAHIRSSIGKFLIARGHTVIEAADGEKGVEVVESQAVDIVITDVKMPGMDGLEVLRRVQSISPETEVIVITGVKEAENAFRALREGAFDFFNKPFKVEDLNAAIQRTVRYQVLRKETSRMQARLDRFEAQEWSGLNAIIGASEVVGNMKAQIKQVAAAGQTTVLIIGETGTGKELVARSVHSESDRAGGPFVPVNCSAIPNNLFESAFFGHKQGAFTDAKTDQKGHFELAHEGTLFLDEIGDMPLDMQVRLLRTLEERYIRPVGGSSEIPVDVRVVAAVEEGTFREDLYYRLNVFVIQVPPLRERAGDVLFLARHFLADYAQDLRKPLMRFSIEAEDLLQQQEFPGNVRMLKNTVERAAILCGDGEVDAEDLGFDPVENSSITEISSMPAERVVDQVVQSLSDKQMSLPAVEKALIQEALRRTGGNQAHAAEILGISRMVLRNRMKRCGML